MHPPLVEKSKYAPPFTAKRVHIFSSENKFDVFHEFQGVHFGCLTNPKQAIILDATWFTVCDKQ